MKRLSFFMTAAALLLASCSDEQLPVQNAGNETQVSFALSLNNQVATKAIADGTTATDLTFVVLDKDGVELDNLRQEVTVSGLQAQVTANLIVGQKYTFAFFACNKASNIYDVTDITAVTVDYANIKAGNAEDRDAFFAVLQDVEITEGYSQSVALKRPFAQLNLVATDKAACEALGVAYTPDSTVLTVTGVANEINLLDGTVKGDETITFEAAGLIKETITIAGTAYNPATNNYLSMNYLLVGADKALADVNMSVLNAAGDTIAKRTYTNIPVQRNYRTNIYGNLLTTAAQFNVEIQPGFDGDENIDKKCIWDGTYATNQTKENHQIPAGFKLFPSGGNQTDRGVIEIWDAEAFAYLATYKMSEWDAVGYNDYYYTWGWTVKLMADLDLAGHPWNPLAIDMYKAFDGNNHTIRNLYVKKPGENNVALFTGRASISNLTVENATVIGGNNVAVVSGYASYMTNIHVKNISVSGAKYVGGVQGHGFATNHVNCSVEGTGNTITATDKEVGGIVGFINVNENNTGLSFVIDTCWVENTTIIGTEEVGGILGRGYANATTGQTLSINGCTTTNVSVTATNKIWFGPILGRNYDGCAEVTIDGNPTAPVAEADGSYTIANAEALSAFASKGCRLGTGAITMNFPTNAVIDMAGYSYVHGEEYANNMTQKVILNGNGATIKNLNVAGKQAALFPWTAQGMEVSNITLKDCSFTSTNVDDNYACAAAFGTFCDVTPVSFTNCTLDNVTISNAKYAGGFVAYCSGRNSSFTNCVVKNSSISSAYTEDGGANYKGHCGGLIGASYGGTVTGCTIENTVFDVKGPRCGIVAGTLWDNLTGTATVKSVSGLTDNMGAVGTDKFSVVVTAE